MWGCSAVGACPRRKQKSSAGAMAIARKGKVARSYITIGYQTGRGAKININWNTLGLIIHFHRHCPNLNKAKFA